MRHILAFCRMKALARSYVWWLKMDADLQQKVRQGSPYQENQKSPPEAPLHPWEWLHKPWVHLHLDYAGLFLGKMFLIVIDAHSNWVEAFPVNSSTLSATVENHFRDTWFARNCRHGQWQQLCQQRVCRFPQTKQNPSHQNRALSPHI